MLKEARAIVQARQEEASRIVAGPAGDKVTPPVRVNPVDISRSSDESSSTYEDELDLEQLLQLTCQKAVQLPKDLQWVISLLLEIRSDQKKNPQTNGKMESDMAKATKIVEDIGRNQRKVIHNQNKIIRLLLETDQESPAEYCIVDDSTPVSSQEPKLLPKEHFLRVRNSQVKNVRVDDWIRWDDLSLIIKPEPETVYVLRSDRPPKDINDGYFWQETEAKKGSRLANPSWSGFCDQKANCQMMIKR